MTRYTIMYKNTIRLLKRDYNLYIMLIPGIIGFILFQYIPIINGIFIGLVDYDFVDGMWKSPWVGLKYIIQFIEDPFFYRLIRNTFLLGLYGLLWGFPASIILALMINEIRNKFFKKITQSLSYLPYFLSIVVVVGILYELFGYSGIINSAIASLGGEPVKFIGNPSWFRTLYIGSGIWQGVGWGSILYLAALSGIEVQLYEAAYIDGASRWQQMRHITLPGIKPTIITLLIINIGSILGVGFEKVFLMYSPTTYSVADVISTYVYRRGIVGFDYSYGGAVSLFNSVISIILISAANFICKKYSDSSIW